MTSRFWLLILAFTAKQETVTDDDFKKQLKFSFQLKDLIFNQSETLANFQGCWVNSKTRRRKLFWALSRSFKGARYYLISTVFNGF